ncbi:hypothetical protein MesoLj131a_09130 [Mesorhizobium sp. 131-2-1]|nr:hypothetical protein MesoLj131a_09130 [Mesorhizobium sp. 131-2-1]
MIDAQPVLALGAADLARTAVSRAPSSVFVAEAIRRRRAEERHLKTKGRTLRPAFRQTWYVAYLHLAIEASAAEMPFSEKT